MLGYFTKYGDGASDINPIADLYKKHIWQLSKHVGLPESIVNKAPSAGLWVGQTDEDELGFKYAQADAYLYYRERFYSMEDACNLAGVDIGIGQEIERRILSSEHKRRGTIVLKLGYRTPTLDWRSPL